MNTLPKTMLSATPWCKRLSMPMKPTAVRIPGNPQADFVEERNMKIPTLMQYIWKGCSNFLQQSRTKKFLSIFIFFSVTILILFSNFNPKQVWLKPDDVAPRNIQSDINAVVIDTQQTELLRQQAISKVQKVYQEDNFALANTERDINLFFSAITSALAQPEEEQISELHTLLNKTHVKKNVFQLQYPVERLASICGSPRGSGDDAAEHHNTARTLMARPSPMIPWTAFTSRPWARSAISAMPPRPER